MEPDDKNRPPMGVVVTLLKLADGTSRVIIDDVRASETGRDTSWKFDCFYTAKRLDSKAAEDMALPDTEYQGLGEAVLARLLALNEANK